MNISNVHWTLAALCYKEKLLKFYDSLGGEGGDFLNVILQYFALLTNTGFSEWTIEVMRNIPRQDNSYDCGVFVCQYSLCLSKGVPLNFHQRNMGKIREIMIEELTTMKLHGRTLVAPSLIPDGAKYNQDIAFDNCCGTPTASKPDISCVAASPLSSVCNPPKSFVAPLTDPLRIPAALNRDQPIFHWDSMADTLPKPELAANSRAKSQYWSEPSEINASAVPPKKKLLTIMEMLEKTSGLPSEKLIQLNVMSSEMSSHSGNK